MLKIIYFWEIDLVLSKLILILNVGFFVNYSQKVANSVKYNVGTEG
jgi:hypothetical protein